MGLVLVGRPLVLTFTLVQVPWGPEAGARFLGGGRADG